MQNSTRKMQLWESASAFAPSNQNHCRLLKQPLVVKAGGSPFFQVFGSGGRSFEVRFRHSFTDMRLSLGLEQCLPNLGLLGSPDD